MTAALLSPFELRSVRCDNRIVVSPMCQYSAEDGSASDWHLMHLGKFAISGAGLVIIEATHVEPIGRITHGCLGLYSDANEAALARVVAFCKRYGTARIGMQVSHSGRKGSARLPWEGRGAPLKPEEGAWETISASAIPFDTAWPAPRALDAAGLAAARDAHVDTVRRALRVGIDVIEAHIAHGYLLHSFLSPLANVRTDAWGGSLANRMRFPLEVFAAIRAAWPDDKPMGVRLSATDCMEGGWTLAETLVFAQELKRLGCDYITASTGGLSPRQKIPLGEGHQVEFADAIRRATGMPTMAVSMIYDPHHANRIIAEAQCDFVALARGMLTDPHWAWHAAAALDGEVRFPPQYIRAYKARWLREKRAGRSAATDD